MDDSKYATFNVWSQGTRPEDIDRVVPESRLSGPCREYNIEHRGDEIEVRFIIDTKSGSDDHD